MPSTRLHLIRYQSAAAPENMAFDEHLLSMAHSHQSAFLRFYGWTQPAFTFGYSQSWSTTNQQANIPFSEIPSHNRIRRLTGGGLVDHRNDLTYALAIPRIHPAATQNASLFYQQLHQALQSALTNLQINSELQACPCQPNASTSSSQIHPLCFTQAEPFDLIVPLSGQKIAGAALRRNRLGLLAQGSLSKSFLPSVNPSGLAALFQSQLAHTFQFLKSPQPFPFECVPSDDSLNRYTSTLWNTKR